MPACAMSGTRASHRCNFDEGCGTKNLTTGSVKEVYLHCNLLNSSLRILTPSPSLFLDSIVSPKPYVQSTLFSLSSHVQPLASFFFPAFKTSS